MGVREIMQQALLRGACEKSNGVSDWKTLSWLLFTPQGVEFCENNKFPSLEMFREMPCDIANFGVFVDAGKMKRSNDANIALVGDVNAELTFDDNTKVHKVILMHGAKAFIVARNYSVVRLINIGGEVKVHSDKTSVILK